MKKNLGDIIILYKCTINDNQMMYGSWDMKRDRQNFLLCWTIFCPFTPPSNPLEISSFYTSVPKIMIICYTVPYIWRITHSIFIFILGYFLHFYLLPESPKNQNLEKMKITPGDIIILQLCTKNHDRMLYSFWDMVRDGCNHFSF